MKNRYVMVSSEEKTDISFARLPVSGWQLQHVCKDSGRGAHLLRTFAGGGVLSIRGEY